MIVLSSILINHSFVQNNAVPFIIAVISLINHSRKGRPHSLVSIYYYSLHSSFSQLLLLLSFIQKCVTDWNWCRNFNLFKQQKSFFLFSLVLFKREWEKRTCSRISELGIVQKSFTKRKEWIEWRGWKEFLRRIFN